MRIFPTSLRWLCCASAIGLFLCSSLKHHLFYSNAYDLACVDQILYRLSQGLDASLILFSDTIAPHPLPWLFYPIALLYKLVPSVYWLFGLQAVALTAGHLGTWQLATQAGLQGLERWAIVLAYGFYPLVFNGNLVDFHLETIAVPLILWAVWAARAGRWWAYAVAVGGILGCGSSLAVTVVGLGLWLGFQERRGRAGAIAVLWGVAAWSLDPVGLLMGGQMTLTKPLLFQFDQIASGETIGYLALLLLPMVWILRLRFLSPMLIVLPNLLLNLMSNLPQQRDLMHHYSMVILPFMVLCGLSVLAAGKPLILKHPSWIIAWSFLGFLSLTKYSYFGWRYLDRSATAPIVRSAIAQIPRDAQVLTHPNLAPHFSGRSIVALTGSAPKLDRVTHALLNRHVAETFGEPEAKLLRQLKDDQAFELRSVQDEVYWFVRQ